MIPWYSINLVRNNLNNELQLQEMKLRQEQLNKDLKEWIAFSMVLET